MTALGAAVLVTALVSVACGEDRSHTSWSTEVSWSSRHFIYHARPADSSVQAGVVDQLEQNASLIRDGWLGQPPGAWGPIHYFKYLSLDDLVAAHSRCNDRPCALLFTSGRIEIHSPLAIDQHELVHGYALPVATPPPLFMEGLAVSLSCDPSVEETVDRPSARPPWLQGSWRDLTSFSDAVGRSYQPAGVLVTWLIDRWGAARFLEFYAALTSTSLSQDQVAAAFATHYGMSLDDVWNQMIAAPRRRLCAFVAGCAEPPATGAVVLSNQSGGHRLALPVPAGGALVRPTYAAASDAPVIRPCAADGALPGFHGYWPAYPTAWAPTVLIPGDGPVVLALRNVNGRSDDPSKTLALALSPLPAPPPDASSCAGVTPIDIDDLSATALIWPQAAPLVMAFRSTVAGPDLTARVLFDGGREATVTSCADCADGVLQGCGDVALADRLHAPWLRVQWSPAVFAPLSLSIQWL